MSEVYRAIADFDSTELDVAFGPNALFHALAAHERDFAIRDWQGAPVSCRAWLCDTASCQPEYGCTIVEPVPSGWRFHPGSTPGKPTAFEAHFGEFSHLLSLLDNVDPRSIPITVSQQHQTATLLDIGRTLQQEYFEQEDASWLIPLLLRLRLPQEWTSRLGGPMNLERVVRSHLDRDSSVLPCFGFHWRSALSTLTNAASGGIPRALQTEVRERLARELCDEWAGFNAATGAFAARLDSLNQPGRHRFDQKRTLEEELTCQGHALEWILDCPADLIQFEAFSSAIRRLCKLLGEARTDTANTLPAQSHAVRALKLFVQATT